jgi:hypothetical protein
MRRALFPIALITLLAATAGAQMSEGDRLWALRAEGRQGGHARAASIDPVIAACHKAVAENPSSIEARWKLLRALRFKGAYVASSNEEKRQAFGTGKKAGEEALVILDQQLAARGLKSPSKATEKEVADAARGIEGAGEVYFWDAVNWGEWALAYGKLAAVREGAADRIRRETTIAMLIDPKLEGGGPERVLGRLHDQTPRVPFITGWASSREAVRFLNESIKIDPTNKITRVFLAEAMVNNNSDSGPQAVEILKQVISTPNDPNYEVEQSRAQEDATELLRKWGAR